MSATVISGGERVGEGEMSCVRQIHTTLSPPSPPLLLLLLLLQVTR